MSGLDFTSGVYDSTIFYFYELYANVHALQYTNSPLGKTKAVSQNPSHHHMLVHQRVFVSYWMACQHILCEDLYGCGADLLLLLAAPLCLGT